MKICRTLTAGACFLAGMTLVAASSYADIPAGYYNSLNGKCGAELRKAVGKIADGHKGISYGSGTWDAFAVTDVKIVDGRRYWWDMYSSNLVSADSGHEGLNIEHSVAKSWWGGAENNMAYKDIVHLNPSDKTANGKKNNYPLAELSSVNWDNGVTFVGTPKSGQGGGSSWGYEPCDEYKGDFARVFMYMFCTYASLPWKSGTAWMYEDGGTHDFKPWAREMLLRWSAADPVSDKERGRNDGVYQKQKNRNPFIDLPDLADHIWGDKKNVPYVVEGAVDPDDPDDPSSDEVTYEWLSQTDAHGADGWDFQNISMDPGLTFIWKWKSYNGSYYLNGSAYNNGANQAVAFAWGPSVDLTGAEKTTFHFEHAAKFQTTLRKLCKVAVMDDSDASVTLLEVPQWPNSGSWSWTDSGEIDLSRFAGKRVRVGFRYGSDSTGSDTWEIRDAVLTVKKAPSGVELMPAENADDDSSMVEVWGNNIIVPEGAVIYNLGGVAVDGRNLPRGVYVVAKPGFRKAVKVMIK